MSYKSDLTKILYMLAEVFSANMSEPLIDAWTAVLIDERISIEQVRAAAIQIMKTRKYTKLPTPADFLDMLKPQENNKEIAETQADDVLDALRGLGPYTLPNFKDPITQELMTRRWPWRTFCMELMSDHVKWWRRDFVEAYCEKKASGNLQPLPPPAPLGLLEGES